LQLWLARAISQTIPTLQGPALTRHPVGFGLVLLFGPKMVFLFPCRNG
jgi:hypothetical protein